DHDGEHEGDGERHRNTVRATTFGRSVAITNATRGPASHIRQSPEARAPGGVAGRAVRIELK
ncbi:MAG TPA: hypothetical protein VK420_22555, partial [Longimicrobium sp.]|nr:hypothetical protein [Longimicrobium sp.]